MKTHLYAAEKQSAFRVTHVPNIKLLENIGVRRGTNLTVMNRYGMGGPVVIRVENAYSVALGKDIAVQIGVSRA
jgi:Fe2+ transport system protein FeoA